MQTRSHTWTQIQILKDTHRNRHTLARKHSQTQSETLAYVHVCTDAHTETQTHTQACTKGHIHADSHTYRLTDTHMQRLADTYMHIQMQTCSDTHSCTHAKRNNTHSHSDIHRHKNIHMQTCAHI